MSVRFLVALFLFGDRCRFLAFGALAWRAPAALFVVVERRSTFLLEQRIFAMTLGQCGMSDIHDNLEDGRKCGLAFLRIPSQAAFENRA
jgi:hypothetical protein